MPKKRRPNRIKTSLKILVLCEGITDLTIIEGMIKGYPNIRAESIDGGGFGKFEMFVDKNEKLYGVILIVADLDKAYEPSGLYLLNKLVRRLHQVNRKNAVFLTGPDIEFWVACCLGDNTLSYEELKNGGYEKGNRVNRFIADNGGSIEKALQVLGEGQKLYYVKDLPDETYAIYPEYVREPQSNLINFSRYIQVLNQ